MTTQIFAYKGIVGISAGDKFINDPTQPGQLGCVVDIKEVEISKDAFDILKTLKRTRGSFADVMCWKGAGSHEEKAFFGWCGGFKAMITVQNEVDRDFDISLLQPQIIEDLQVPEDFKNAIDK